MRAAIPFFLLLLFHHFAEAGPGDVDRSFAPGEAITCLGESGPVTAMAVMADGTAIMGGQVLMTSFAASNPYALSRLGPEGVTDYSENERGILYVGTQVSALSTQADGKLMLALSSPGVRLVRFSLNPGFTADPSFSSGDLIASTDPDYGNLFDVSMISLADGRSIVAGVGSSGALRRVLASGGQDPGFGISGVARHAMWPKCLALQSDGKILVGGKQQQPGGGGTDFAIARFSSQGILDTSFGTAGTVALDLGSGAEVCLGLLALADGHVIATGQSGSQQVVVRFTPGGALDTSFGTNGHAASPFPGGSSALSPLPGDDGRFVVVGRHDSADVPPVSFHHLVCYTEAGAVYPLFGSNGVTTAGRAETTGSENSRRAFVTRLTDGSIMLGRHVWNGIASSFRLIRVHPDGTLDSSYGGGTIRLAASDADMPNRSAGRHLRLLPNGSVLLPSRRSSSASNGITEVHAFLMNGSPEPGFGTSGVLSLNDADGLTLAGSSLAVLPDGRFALGGARLNSPSWAHTRRLAAGPADPAFNSGHMAYSAVASTGINPVMEMVFDAHERLVSAGYATVSGSNTDVVLTRHLSDGAPDPSFGQNGIVKTHVATSDTAFALDVQPDDRLLVCGGSGSSSLNPTPTMARYLENGALDPTFGNGGVVAGFAGAPVARITNVAMLSDGRFLAVMSSPTSSRSDKPALFCFQSNGSLDTTFGSGGRALDFQAGVNGRLQAVAVQKDGRIVVTGAGLLSNDLIVEDVTVWRYEANGVPDSSFGQFGRRIVPVSAYTDSGTSIEVTANNKILVATQSTISGEGAAAFCGIICLEGGPLLANLALSSPADRSASTVRLRGTVNPNGFVTSALFEYGPTASYGQSVPLTLIDEDGTITENVETLLSGLSAGTTYHYRLTATTAAGTRSTPDSTFSTFSSLESWRQTHFGIADNTGSAADTEDFDLDGIPNLLEWASGLSPAQSSRLDTPVTRNGAVIEFTYSRDTLAVGAVYQVEWSDTLPGTSWSSAGVTETILNQSGSIQTVKASLPAGSNGSRFVRLRVQGPP